MKKFKHITVNFILVLIMGVLVLSPTNRVTALEISEPIQYGDEEWSRIIGNTTCTIYEVEVDPLDESFYVMGRQWPDFFVAKLDADGNLLWFTNFSSSYYETTLKGLILSRETEGPRLYTLMTCKEGIREAEFDIYIVMIDPQSGNILDSKSLDFPGEEFDLFSECFMTFHSNQHHRLFIAISPKIQTNYYKTRIIELDTTLMDKIWDYEIPLQYQQVQPAGFHYALSSNILILGVNYRNSTNFEEWKSKIWRFAPSAGSTKTYADITAGTIDLLYINAMTVNNGRIMCLLHTSELLTDGYWRAFKTWDYNLIPQEFDPETSSQLSYNLHPTKYPVTTKKMVALDFGERIMMVGSTKDHNHNVIYPGYEGDAEAIIMTYRYDADEEYFGLADYRVFGNIQQDFNIYDFEIISSGIIFCGVGKPNLSTSTYRGILTKFPICDPEDLTPPEIRALWNEDLPIFILQNGVPLAVTGGAGVAVGGAIIGGVSKIRRKK